jgi:hypothetical protein
MPARISPLSFSALALAAVLATVCATALSEAAPRLPSVRSLQPANAAGCTSVGKYSFLANKESNAASGIGSSILGGTGNQVCDDASTIGAGDSNSIDTGNDSGPQSFIGAGSDNVISAERAFIGGGSVNSVISSTTGVIGAGSGNHMLHAPSGFIGAGGGNTITGAVDAAIGGGGGNTIGTGASYGVIVGGDGNAIAARSIGEALDGFIGGGLHNTVNGTGAVVGGGYGNIASGDYATIPGGYRNLASGRASFAAGSSSYAVTPGSFVWSDYNTTSAHVISTRPNEFLVRATGGVEFFTNAAQTTGVVLAPGSGTWSSASDRALKDDVAPLDDGAILARLASLPLAEWSYRSERGVRHIGPMAQDFYAAFHVGEDDRHIATIDEDGVALSALKALRAENGALKREIALARAESAATERQVDNLLARLSAFEKASRK